VFSFGILDKWKIIGKCFKISAKQLTIDWREHSANITVLKWLAQLSIVFCRRLKNLVLHM
jgi:hypothetical protein